MSQYIINAIKDSLANKTDTGVIVQNVATGTPTLIEAVPSASANTFGSWIEADASTSADSWLCTVTATPNVYTSVAYVLEVGTGTAGNEVAIARWTFAYNYNLGAPTQTTCPIVLTLPVVIKLPAGTRVAVRSANTGTSANNSLFCGISMYQGLEN